MAHWFKKVFAESGDLGTIPETTDPNGYVSEQTGWTANYSQVKGTANAKTPERTKFNRLFNWITGALQQYQTNGFPEYIDATANGGTAYAYALNAIVRFTDGLNYRNIVAANTNAPNVSGWVLYNDPATAIVASTAKTTPASADIFGYVQASDGVLKKFTWTNFLASLSSLFAPTDSPALAKAWVNFNGVPLSGTYSQTGTAITVTMTSHGMETGMIVNLDFTTGTATDGVDFVVTNTGTNTFTVVGKTSVTTSGNVTRNNYIRKAYNVNSITDNSVGDYTINFTTVMPDTYYSLSGMSLSASATTASAWFAIKGAFATGATLKTTSAVEIIIAGSSTTTDVFEADVTIFG